MQLMQLCKVNRSLFRLEIVVRMSKTERRIDVSRKSVFILQESGQASTLAIRMNTEWSSMRVAPEFHLLPDLTGG
jgi:uncharacterized membrane protein